MPITLPPFPALPVPTPVDLSDCPPPDDHTVPPVPPVLPPKPGLGKGNLLYVSTQKGLAVCFQAFGTDGSDGAPIWGSANGTTPFNLVGTALHIRHFELDPWSAVTDELGEHLTAGYAMTDDGLYRVTGLPNTPVWTQQLTSVQANTLAGNPGTVFGGSGWEGWGVGQGGLSYNFCTSERLTGFIAILLVFNTNYQTLWHGINMGVYSNVAFTVYSYDYGETFQCDGTKFVLYPGVALGAARDTFYIRASSNEAGTYYLANTGVPPNDDQVSESAVPYLGVTSPRISLMRVPGMRGGAFPDFSPGCADGYSGYLGAFPHVFFPKSNNAKVNYTDDNRAYFYGGRAQNDYRSADAIHRFSSAFSPLWSVGYTVPSSVAVGSTLMYDISHLETHRFNEDKACAISFDDINHDYGIGLYFTSDLSTGSPPTWSVAKGRVFPFSSGQLGFGAHDLASIPVDSKIWFFAGEAASHNGYYGMAVFTPDFGTTFVDFSLHGVAGGIDSIMSLVGISDLANSQIAIDTHFLGNLFVATGNGIDVSHYQGTMNWATAYGAGVRFAFIKSSQGTASTDSAFATNWAGAGAQSIKRGAYHYFMNALDPTTQANHFVATATSAGELGYAVDCEDETATLVPADLKTFLDRVETLTGTKCIIYTRASWWNSRVGFQSWAADYPLWVANWNVAVPTLPNGWTAWAYWQFTVSPSGITYGAQSASIDLDKALGA